MTKASLIPSGEKCGVWLKQINNNRNKQNSHHCSCWMFVCLSAAYKQRSPAGKNDFQSIVRWTSNSHILLLAAHKYRFWAYTVCPFLSAIHAIVISQIWGQRFLDQVSGSETVGRIELGGTYIFQMKLQLKAGWGCGSLNGCKKGGGRWHSAKIKPESWVSCAVAWLIH